MRQTISLAAALLLAGACTQRPREYAGPAPAGAMECAEREASTLGYSKMEGSREERVLRMSQRMEPSPVERRGPGDALPGPPQVAPTPPDRPTENQLRIREARGRLTVQVVSVVESDLQPGSGAPSADDHARIIVARCTEG